MSQESKDGTKEFTAQEVLKMAIELHQRMEFANARQMYEKVIEVWPDCADALHFSGLLAFHADKDIDRAIALVEKSLALVPEHADFQNNYGNLLKTKGRLQEAMDAYKKALEVRPDFPDVYNNLGLMLQNQKDYADAIEVFQKAIQYAPNDVLPYLNLGNVLGIQDRWDEAEAAYKKVIELCPDESEGYYRLGRLYWLQDRAEDAIRVFQKSTENNPDRSDSFFELGQVFDRRGRTVEAAEAYERAIENDSENWVAHHALGMTYNELGKVNEAVEIWKRWMKGEPENPVPRHMLTAGLGNDVLGRAEDDYVQKSFDIFARTFDRKLAQLKYRAPEFVAEALKNACGAQTTGLDILDAGCGTGLCAPLLRPSARTLIGVDLSPGMLDKARERGGYDELHAAELTEFISRFELRFDAIISADTLCYFGNLEAVIKATARALRPGGGPIFTVEESKGAQAQSDFHLSLSGRYTHARDYIERTIGDGGFAKPSITTEVLRMESLKPVEGLVVVARRTA